MWSSAYLCEKHLLEKCLQGEMGRGQEEAGEPSDHEECLIFCQGKRAGMEASGIVRDCSAAQESLVRPIGSSWAKISFQKSQSLLEQHALEFLLCPLMEKHGFSRNMV